MKHDPPTSEKAYDGNPAAQLRAAQSSSGAARSTNMKTVAAASGGGSDEPMHDAAPKVLRKAATHLESQSHGGIHKVGC